MRHILTCICILFSSLIWADERYPAPIPQRPERQLPNHDPLIEKSWHLQAIGATRVWQMSEGSPRTLIAIVDSGIDYNHPDIAPNIRWNMAEYPPNGRDKDGNGFIDDVIGWDFVKNNNLPFDRAGHGTFLAGIIGGVKDNGIGSAGVCPKCQMMGVRFLNWEGLGDTEDAIKGLYYAVKQGASIINFSFAGEGHDADLLRALQFAASRDVFVVVSASNDHLNNDYNSIYPANFDLPNMITVAAADREGKLWEGSNWGKRKVHLAAPGDDILGPWLGKWDTGSGTSDAAAVASGAVGLLRSIAPQLRASQIKAVLMRTARVVPMMKGKTVTEGLLDIEAAVRCVTVGQMSCL